MSFAPKKAQSEIFIQNTAMNELIQPHRCPRSSPNPICVIWNLKYFLFSHGHSFGVEKANQLFCYQSSLQFSLFRVIPTATNISTYIPTFNLTYIYKHFICYIYSDVLSDIYSDTTWHPVWRFIWQSFWHLIWHSICHIFWHYLT